MGTRTTLEILLLIMYLGVGNARHTFMAMQADDLARKQQGELFGGSQCVVHRTIWTNEVVIIGNRANRIDVSSYCDRAWERRTELLST